MSTAYDHLHASFEDSDAMDARLAMYDAYNEAIKIEIAILCGEDEDMFLNCQIDEGMQDVDNGVDTGSDGVSELCGQTPVAGEEEGVDSHFDSISYLINEPGDDYRRSLHI